MKRKVYSREEKEILMENKHIEKVTDKYVIYTKDFKLFAEKQSIKNNKLPTEIFL